PVCQAVQHAHQKGIIHRDLKPSNVLIAQYDGKPVPKVIDFGVAKASGQKLTERTMFTEVGQIVGTLEYMSPEQAELNNLDIDTRTDIYALGVILYELLTGAVPFSRKELQSAAFAEMLRLIKEVEPPRPSTRLSGSGSLLTVAARRPTGGAGTKLAAAEEVGRCGSDAARVPGHPCQEGARRLDDVQCQFHARRSAGGPGEVRRRRAVAAGRVRGAEGEGQEPAAGGEAKPAGEPPTAHRPVH